MTTTFTLKSSETMAARIGRLALPGRASLETPHYIAHTSRGLVPHLSQDSFRMRTGITAVYLGLEECRRHRYHAPSRGC